MSNTPTDAENHREHMGCIRAARAPADNVLEDAARYQWLRGLLSFEDIDHLVSESFGTPNEAESLKTDAAVDAARKQGNKV